MDELGLLLSFDGKTYKVEPQAGEPGEASPSESTLRRRGWLRRRKNDAPADDPPQPAPLLAETPGELLELLINQLNERPTPPNAKPSDQPEAVHELADRLFGAYTLDGGKAHLAGCHLTDSPLVRLTELVENEDGAVAPLHRYYDELGAPLSDDMVKRLGVDRVEPFSNHPPRLDEGRLSRMLESAWGGNQKSSESVALATIVWAKKASGRLRFEFGEESVDTPFEGWASLLDPPPVTCPMTGQPTFHLATVEGGLIAAAEEIATCEVSSERRVRSELQVCTATGKKVDPKHLGECSVSGDLVLADRLSPCPKCGQKVSPLILSPGDCRGCVSPTRVSKEDSRIAAIVDEHPHLLGKGDPSRSWSLSETRTAYVLERVGWFRRRVVTLDKQTLKVLRQAKASRFSPTWRLV